MCFQTSLVKAWHDWNWNGDEIVHLPIVPASRVIPAQYGAGQAHGFDHIIRTTGSGNEFYFSPNAFQLFQ